MDNIPVLCCQPIINLNWLEGCKEMKNNNINCYLLGLPLSPIGCVRKPDHYPVPYVWDRVQTLSQCLIQINANVYQFNLLHLCKFTVIPFWQCSESKRTELKGGNRFDLVPIKKFCGVNLSEKCSWDHKERKTIHIFYISCTNQLLRSRESHVTDLWRYICPSKIKEI